MKISKIMELLCTALLCVCLCCQSAYAAAPPSFSAASFSAPDSAPAREPTTLDKVSESFTAAQPIYERLIEIVREDIAAAAAEENEDDDSEPDLAELEAAIKEVEEMRTRLNGLLEGLSGLPDDMDTSEGKTVLAARQFLTMLRDMAGDMAELRRYDMDFYKALLPMTLSDEEVTDFVAFAEELFNAIDESQSLVAKITPPAYIVNSHNDVVKRLGEFQDFSADFYMAISMGDPLRIYSCMYRMNRITVMFERCDANLQADIDLQTKQAEHRLSGPIAQLHDELERNLTLLGAA